MVPSDITAQAATKQCWPGPVHLLMQAVVFHLWSRAYRHTFQADIAVDHAARKASQGKIRKLPAVNRHVAASDKAEIDGRYSVSTHNSAAALYSIGQSRSIQQFWQHCDLDTQ